jgi:hypothetical protein
MFYLLFTIFYILVAIGLGEYLVKINPTRVGYQFTPSEDRKFTYISFAIIFVLVILPLMIFL